MARLCGGGRGLGGLARAWRGGRGPGGRGQALQSWRKAQAGTPACRPQRWTEERPPAPGDRCRKDRNQENEHSNQQASFLIKNMGSDAAGTRHFSPVGWAKIKGLIKAAVGRGERKRAPSCVDSATVFTSTMNEETLGPRSSRPRNGGSELVHHFPPSINCRVVYDGEKLETTQMTSKARSIHTGEFCEAISEPELGVGRI